MRTRTLVFAAAALVATVGVQAQQFPSKPIRVVVPYTAGGTADILARTLSQRLSERLGQPVVVDNRPGANGMIGAELVARAAPDGHMILFGATGPNAINSSLYPKIPYDPIASFAPITLVAVTTSVLVTHPLVPARSVKELVRVAKARPGGLTYGSAGIGGLSHLAGEMFSTMAGIKLTHVAYRGMAPGVIDLLGGHIDLMFATMPGTLQHIEDRRLNALAVATARRSSVLPQLPTVAEAGLPGFEASAFFGMFAPARTPRTTVTRLNESFVAILKDPDVRTLLTRQGAEPVGDTPDEFAAFIKAQIVRWAKVIKASNIKPN